MTQDHELKPCAHCGNKAKIIRNSYIICTFCPSHMPDIMNIEELVKCWNTRASERRLDFHKIADVIHENAKSFFQVDGQKEVWTETPSFKTAKEIMNAYNEGKLWEDTK